MTDLGTHSFGDGCPGGHLPPRVAEMLDRCIAALVAGEREIEIGGMPYLRDVEPADIDNYAASRLPRELWGTPLRLVWQRGRTESAALTFCEDRDRLPAAHRAVLEQVAAGDVWIDGPVVVPLLLEQNGLIEAKTFDGVSRWVLTSAGEQALGR